ncbi:RNA-directed DNA polymerase from mobile element jockey [Smittium mucronatum]|uniref:RNA-directed DNA polymerase from mobile element jockey n=1 Tax=Smittium mucronatum TaxID=133383 RepID=A0A1R0GRB3_9FUNG|nr:RNA-directed DNA polymerase from mobile element jockey [Smittium mucronatum]
MFNCLKVGYYNCNGLSNYKWEYVVSALSSGSFDMIFLAETWFVDQSFHESSPLHVCSSRLGSNRRSAGRQKNGMMLLSSPSLRQHISMTATSEFAVQVQVFGQLIVGVYFPPSLSVNTIREYIPAKNISLLLGDINTFFGSSFGQVRNRPSDRINFFDGLASQNRWIHLRPAVDNNFPDHAFCNSEIKATWDVFSGPSVNRSDHSLMICTVQLDSVSNHSPSFDSIRYNLKDISEPIIRSRIISEYEGNRKMIVRFFNYIKGIGRSHGYSELVKVVDFSYESIFNLFHEICRSVLGSYSVFSAKSSCASGKFNTDALNSVCSASEAAKIYKKSLKQSTMDHSIQSRDCNLSAVQDVYNYYSDLYSPPPIVSSDSVSFDSALFPDDLGLKFFSASKIKSSIIGYSDSKATGPDNVHISVLKVLAESTLFLDDLSEFFSLCCKFGVTPSEWNNTLIHPISKTGTSGTIENFRPITLTSTVRKIFESCLLVHIEETQLVQVHQTQSGFRKDHSTMGIIIATNDLLFLSPPYNRPNRIFLDLSNAYDRVSMDILIGKMISKGISYQLICLIKSLFMNTKSRISVNGTLTDVFTRHTGLLQGSILSPLLFNFYINDLACALSAASCNGIPSALFYADDIQLLPISRSHAKNLLKIFSDWLDSNNMILNIKKSAFIGPSPWNLHFNGQLLPKPSSYNYLGMPYTDKGFDVNKYCRSAGFRAMNQIKSLQKTGKIWHPLVKLNIFKSFVRSIWEYPSPILNLPKFSADLTPLEDAQSAGLSWVAGVSLFHGKQYKRLIASLCGVESVADRLETLGIKFSYNFEQARDSDVLLDLIKLIKSKNIYIFPQAYLSSEICSIPAYKSNFESISENYNKYFFDRRLSNISKIKAVATDRIRLIKPESRNPINLADVSFYLSNKMLINQAIRWRMSSYGFGTDCPVCHEKFKYTHVQRCLGILNFDKYFVYSKKNKLEAELTKLISLAPPNLSSN